MVYYYEKISYKNGKWYVHLLIPSKQELNDSFEYITNGLETPQNLCLPLENARYIPLISPNYRTVTSQHQINSIGNLFVSSEWDIQQQPYQIQTGDITLHATQYNYDKFCFNNPDEQGSFDWNAEVYKVFISSTPGIYTSASQNESP